MNCSCRLAMDLVLLHETLICIRTARVDETFTVIVFSCEEIPEGPVDVTV